METINEVFSRYLPEYLKASKSRKQAILDTVCELTGFHRKSATRKFKVLQMRSASVEDKRGRPVLYTPDVIVALKEVWTVGSEVCGELLHPMVDEYVNILKRDKMWHHRPNTTKLLLQMSEGTIKTKVGSFMKARHCRKGVSSTSPSLLKNIIPIFIGPWQDKPPGYGQTDTVVHCGSTLAGDMVFSVNYTDIATMWLGLAAQWNKGQVATKDSLNGIMQRLPFKLKGLHPDTGSEFINWHVKGWCDENEIEYTRSRPNHKNDNAYVEQKNGHVIRRFLGYNRLDVNILIPLVNEMYEVLEIYLNHFVSSRKCVKKVRIGSRYKRKYDKAQTPYQRVLNHDMIDQDIKDKLIKQHQTLNPLILKNKVDKLITKIFKIQRQDGNRHGGIKM